VWVYLAAMVPVEDASQQSLAGLPGRTLGGQ